MALPTSRNKTYAPGDPVRAADLNDVQDQIITVNGRVEVGSFTPVLVNNGVTHATYGWQVGRFLRIDNWVSIEVALRATSLDPDGTLAIAAASLPFAPTLEVVDEGFIVSRFRPGPASGVYVFGRMGAGGNIYLVSDQELTVTSWAALTSGTHDFCLSGHYLTA